MQVTEATVIRYDKDAKREEEENRRNSSYYHECERRDEGRSSDEREEPKRQEREEQEERTEGQSTNDIRSNMSETSSMKRKGRESGSAVVVLRGRGRGNNYLLFA